MEQAENRLKAAFEFLQKLGVPYYCFHDRDLAPQGETFAESCRNLERMVEKAKTMQEETGIKLLWGNCQSLQPPTLCPWRIDQSRCPCLRLCGGSSQTCHCGNQRTGRHELCLLGGKRGI